MSESWTDVRLGDLVTLQRGHDLPARLRVPGPFPVVGSGGPSGWHNEAKAQGPGVVIGRATNLGRPFWVEGPFWPLNTGLYVKDFRGNDPRFVFHLFEFLDLSGFDSGSVQPMLNRNYIAGVKLRVPPLDEQRRIAGVLGALDDLIETNQRIMAAMQETLTAAYRRLMTGETRPVPLLEAFEVDFGAAFKGSEFTAPGEGLPLLRIRDLKTFQSDVWTRERINGDTVVNPGDVVVAMDAEFRSTLWLGRPSLLNQRVCRVRPRIGSLSFVREALVAPLAFIEGHKTGTTVIHLNKRDLQEAKILMPAPEALAYFDGFAEPIRGAIVSLYQENRTLGGARDELLPLLLSGRVSVREVAA